MFLGLLTPSAHAGTLATSPRQPVIIPAGIEAHQVHQAHIGVSGIAHLQTNLDLQPTASGTWADAALQVTLPAAGTYVLNLDVRGLLQGGAPVNAYIIARLFNVTSGTVVPNSARIGARPAAEPSAGVFGEIRPPGRPARGPGPRRSVRARGE
ncbi:hypothetical protein ACIBCT_25535 [Streptosporangium sp. NPDC050855]|uniref:hypothetical protein n=1 Tax=Streptosporangium sp. NPDC050855 TaxID=3366194 RepID=UPI0037BDC4C1